MPRTIVLDSSPLGTVTKRHGVAEADACRHWIAGCQKAAHIILVPAIAYYEVARELHRLGNTAAIARLDAFCDAPGRYLPLTDAAIKRAAVLWAPARNAGTPTADPKELDCDVLIAGQTLDLADAGADVVMATMNVGHLKQFCPAALWTDILP